MTDDAATLGHVGAGRSHGPRARALLRRLGLMSLALLIFGPPLWYSHQSRQATEQARAWNDRAHLQFEKFLARDPGYDWEAHQSLREAERAAAADSDSYELWRHYHQVGVFLLFAILSVLYLRSFMRRPEDARRRGLRVATVKATAATLAVGVVVVFPFGTMFLYQIPEHLSTLGVPGLGQEIRGRLVPTPWGWLSIVVLFLLLWVILLGQFLPSDDEER